LAASVNALVEEWRKSREFKEHFHREPDQLQSRLNKEKLEMQISRNLDDNINRLIDIKRKLESETNPGIIKVLKKYEKRLTKAIGMSSSSKNDSD
jgi:beta-phosphoglucomutase-like phosphatase (HAD superfamily)